MESKIYQISPHMSHGASFPPQPEDKLEVAAILPILMAVTADALIYRLAHEQGLVADVIIPVP